jgi:hypothetical protein
MSRSNLRNRVISPSSVALRHQQAVRSDRRWNPTDGDTPLGDGVEHLGGGCGAARSRKGSARLCSLLRALSVFVRFGRVSACEVGYTAFRRLTKTRGVWCSDEPVPERLPSDDGRGRPE